MLSWNPANRFVRLPTNLETPKDHYLAGTLFRLDRLASAIDFYFIKEGELPVSLNDLTSKGYLSRELARDPLGRPIQYQPQIDRNTYSLSASDLMGRRTKSLQRSKSFADHNSNDQSF